MAPGTAATLPDINAYVGKADSREVLVTTWRTHRDSAYLVIARWPRTHRFYTPTPDGHAAHLFTETARQALALLAHAALDVPLSYRLGWEKFTSTVSPDQLRARTNPATTVRLLVSYTSVTRRRLGSVHLSASVTATRGEVPLGTAHMQYTAYPPRLYNRLRGRFADAEDAFTHALPTPPPLPPALVGRHRPSDVVLSPATTPRTWRLRPDTHHPVLFDHPHDHIPGMVLLEACSQAATADANPQHVTPIGFDTTFSRYVELDQPCWITAHDMPTTNHSHHRTRIHGTQNGKTTFSSTVTTQTTPTNHT